MPRREDLFVPPSHEEFVQDICDLLFELSQYRLSIDDNDVATETDTGRRAVYTGLLMLHEELKYQNDQRAAFEAQLKQREARMRALIDLAKVAIWDCSIDGVRRSLEGVELRDNGSPLNAHDVREITRRLVIQGINIEGLRMLGAKSADEVASKLDELAMADGGALFAALWRGLAQNATVVEAEGTLQTLQGETLTVLAGLSVPQTPGGHDLAIITFADITAHHARIAAEQEAKRRGVELMRVNAEVERLFYAVAHDLRSPLRAADQLAGWAAEDLDGGDLAEVTKHLRTLRGRIGRLDRMMSDLLSYAKIGRAELEVEEVDVGSILQEIKGGLLSMPPGFELTWSQMPTLTTQRTLLSQVFLNLISNALKHHDRDSGRIEVAAEEKQDRVVFRVTDDGPGIEVAFREKIFGLFATLKRRDEVEGSGMGLAFVQKVVRRAGGQVVAEGPPGRGITFAFDWPRVLES